MTAFVRSPDKVAVRHPHLQLVVGSVPEDESKLAEAMRGQDVVVSALGRGLSFKSTNLIQRSVPAILAAMHTHGVRRLILMSSMGVGDSIRDAPLLPRIMFRLLLGDIYADKAAGEALIQRSGLDWTIVKPAQLTNGPLTRTYRDGESLALRGVPKISRADVADFILRQVEHTAYLAKVAVISY